MCSPTNPNTNPKRDLLTSGPSVDMSTDSALIGHAVMPFSAQTRTDKQSQQTQSIARRRQHRVHSHVMTLKAYLCNRGDDADDVMRLTVAAAAAAAVGLAAVPVVAQLLFSDDDGSSVVVEPH